MTTVRKSAILHLGMQTQDLIPTATVAKMLGKSVATINRWAAEGDRLKPAIDMGGRTGARLFRRSDVEALLRADCSTGAS